MTKTIKELLDELGDTRESAQAVLEAAGIDCTPRDLDNHPCECPLAHYLKKNGYPEAYVGVTRALPSRKAKIEDVVCILGGAYEFRDWFDRKSAEIEDAHVAQ